MISSLHGKIESLGSDHAVIDVNGIGFQVYMPTTALTSLGIAGDEVRIHTHLHLRVTTSASMASPRPRSCGFSKRLSACPVWDRGWP